MKNQKVEKRIRRHRKIRSTVSGTEQRPRISVFKSNRDLFVQVIDDVAKKTLLSISTKKVSGKTKLEKSKTAGLELAKEMKAKKITEGVYDRGGNSYIGRVAAFAEGLREGGLKI
jgi:large subunit ribosomal protein L18